MQHRIASSAGDAQVRIPGAYGAANTAYVNCSCAHSSVFADLRYVWPNLTMVFNLYSTISWQSPQPVTDPFHRTFIDISIDYFFTSSNTWGIFLTILTMITRQTSNEFLFIILSTGIIKLSDWPVSYRTSSAQGPFMESPAPQGGKFHLSDPVFFF